MDGATINRGNGVNGPWPCDLCKRAFTAKIGRGQQKKRAHAEEVINAINVVKGRWPDEEVQMMERSEAMNHYLLTQVPNRTRKAIETSRKNPEYKQLVVNMSRMELNDSAANSKTNQNIYA